MEYWPNRDVLLMTILGGVFQGLTRLVGVLNEGLTALQRSGLIGNTDGLANRGLGLGNTVVFCSNRQFCVRGDGSGLGVLVIRNGYTGCKPTASVFVPPLSITS